MLQNVVLALMELLLMIAIKSKLKLKVSNLFTINIALNSRYQKPE